MRRMVHYERITGARSMRSPVSEASARIYVSSAEKVGAGFSELEKTSWTKKPPI